MRFHIDQSIPLKTAGWPIQTKEYLWLRIGLKDAKN